ncbi:uncharacterized protein LOC117318031, partial [Pecten maximus]|uniref:uncharacterized protein LOC117318031 n=1 Tax=Pecten maximus TaxID=6579 RepID=UPI001457E897
QPYKQRGQSPGTKFTLGLTEIRYSATDSAGNTSPDCIFLVYVDQQICDPPKINDQYMEIECPEGFSFGSECNLTCRGSYPLIGSDTISCVRNKRNPKKVHWYMGRGEKPYCKQNNCPDLLPPLHGALTCDDWMFGTHCMMHCNEEYDIPAGAGDGDITRFTGQFVCSTSSGKWFPAETVPGCTVKRDPQNLYLPGEVYYFTGSCNDTATQQKIKENFIKEMQKLYQNSAGGICPNSDDCNVDNVNLKCGAARRRRDLYKTRRTRQMNGASVLVTFQIVVKLEKYSNITDTKNQLERKAASLGSLMEEKVESGSLDVEGAEVEQDSFQTAQATIKCEPGRYPRYTTLTCASCPLGSVYDDVLEECTECPKGYYRDDDDVVTCTQCPSGTSTPSSGTVKAIDCVPICAQGYYSLTGVSPCTPCSRYQYGSQEMATQCKECGPGLMTSSFASTDESDCSVFDAVIGGEMLPQTVGQLQNGANGFTLALWIKIPQKHDASLQVRINNDIQINIGRNINITFHRTHLQTHVELNRGAWRHIAVVSDAINVKVFVQGDVKFTSRTRLRMPRRASDVQISSAGNSDADIHISGLFLTPTSVYDGDIKSLSSTCYHTRKGDVTMDGLKCTESNNIELVSPSVCDAEDNCDPDPCHGNTCIDDLVGFTCHCGGGFSGNLCQIPPKYCLNHQCKNGASCNNLQTNYTCLCATGFKGIFCEYEKVDGGWGTWNIWSDCSKTCGGGYRTRQRECNNPYPDPDGETCIGETMETGICYEELCPVCPPRPGSYGTMMDCNVTSELTTCRVQCKDGLWFAPGYSPLPEYKCGAETAYEWNGKPPSCSEVYFPNQFETVSMVSYDSKELCHKEKDMISVLMMKALDNIECLQTETCQIDVSVEGCDGQLEHFQNGVAAKAVITLKMPLTTEEFNIVNNPSSTAASPIIMNLLRVVSTLENSTKQLNTSTDILRIVIDGQEYNALSVESYGKVDCPDGQIQLQAFCIDCPEGTYNQNGSNCFPCPYGTYQDTPGSTSCKKCPDGFLTRFLESTDITECSVPSTVPTKETATVSKEDIIIGCIAGALFVCAVIVGIAVWQFLRRKRPTHNITVSTTQSLGDELCISGPHWTPSDINDPCESNHFLGTTKPTTDL